MMQSAFFLMLLLLPFAGWTQSNLVKNGGFDTVSVCPSSLSQVSLSYWTIPLNHSGSSDLFNACATSASVSVPSNFRADNCPAFNGTGYIGGYVSLGNNNVYREYICDTLKQPLVAGSRYVVSFMYRLADQAELSSDDIGFYLSQTQPNQSGTGFLGVTPTSHNPSGNFLVNTDTWLLYSDTIIAAGGEEFITVGAFDSIPASQPLDSNFTGSGWAYYFYDSVSIREFEGFEVDNVCLGDSVYPFIDTLGIDSIFWDFGDPGSGSDNFSNLLFPSHYYNTVGLYEITVIRLIGSVLDTLTEFVQVFPRQSIDLGPDVELCEGDSVLFSAAQSHATFEWQDGTTLDSIWIDATETVWVTVFGVCDTVSDTVEVLVSDSLVFDLGPDTLLCDGTGYLLDPGLPSTATLTWTGGATSDTLLVTTSGDYSLTATNGCGTVMDSVTITFKPVPNDSFLPPDTLNCFDNEIVLDRPDEDSVTYIWSDSSGSKTYTVDTTETVWLAAFNECGFSVDTINIVFNGEILSELGEDTAICEGDSIALVATHPGATYLWNTGEVSDTIWTDQVESFNYVVTITYDQCRTLESKRVDMDDFYCPSIDCSLQYANTFSPNSDGINDRFRPWSDCDIYSFSMSIYNRWGQLIHFDSHVKFGWDGQVNGQPAPEGVYYFVIDFDDRVVVDEDRNIYQGSFTLIR